MFPMIKFIGTLLILIIVINVASGVTNNNKLNQENLKVKKAARDGDNVEIGIDVAMPDDAIIITGDDQDKLQGSIETGEAKEPEVDSDSESEISSDPEQFELLFSKGEQYLNAPGKPSLNWPLGIVQYYINRTVYDEVIIDRITQSMELIESLSCLLFKEIKSSIKYDSGAWLHITNPNNEIECVHTTPDNPSANNEIIVVIGFNCIHPEEILHTLLHGIGLYDEVTHPHRDQYIRVLWENIQPKYRPLYGIRHTDPRVPLSEYDPSSIMHFHDRAFSANGGATIASLVPGLTISHKHTLSQLDVMKLQLAFGHGCKKRQVDGLIDTCKNAFPDVNTDPVDKMLSSSSESKYNSSESTVGSEIEAGNLDENDYSAAPNDVEPKEIVERRTKNRLRRRKWGKNRG